MVVCGKVGTLKQEFVFCPDEDGSLWVSVPQCKALMDEHWSMFVAHPHSTWICKNRHEKETWNRRQRHLPESSKLLFPCGLNCLSPYWCCFKTASPKTWVWTAIRYRSNFIVYSHEHFKTHMWLPQLHQRYRIFLPLQEVLDSIAIDCGITSSQGLHLTGDLPIVM